MDCNTIDLNQAEQAVSQLLSDNRQEYQRRKLQARRHRYYHLPLYSTKSFGPDDHLLLPNVPGLFSLKAILTTNSSTLNEDFTLWCSDLFESRPKSNEVGIKSPLDQHDKLYKN